MSDSFMPKKAKTYPKNKTKKTQRKAQLKPVSITTRKSYWVTLTFSIIVLVFALGYFESMSTENIAMMLATVLMLIGFVFYLRFTPSYSTVNKRATFIFVGASIIGFCIWAAAVLSLNATILHPQVAAAISDSFFATTSLIICLISGAFIGDLIDKNKERITFFVNSKFRK